MYQSFERMKDNSIRNNNDQSRFIGVFLSIFVTLAIISVAAFIFSGISSKEMTGIFLNVTTKLIMIPVMIFLALTVVFIFIMVEEYHKNYDKYDSVRFGLEEECTLVTKDDGIIHSKSFYGIYVKCLNGGFDYLFTNPGSKDEWQHFEPAKLGCTVNLNFLDKVYIKADDRIMVSNSFSGKNSALIHIDDPELKKYQ